MGRALGDVLPLAVAVAVFPVPIIAVVLVLASDRGLLKGVAFVVAWCAGLGAVGAVVLALSGTADASEGGEPATWTSLLQLGLGLLLLALAAKQWVGRPRAGEEAPMPGWMRKVNEFTVAKAAGAGFALSALNPKNILLVAAAAAEIAAVGLAAGREAVVLLAFVVVASLGVLTPIALSLVLRSRAAGVLDGIRRWMAANNAVIMTVLFVLIGAKLIGDAIAGLSG